MEVAAAITQGANRKDILDISKVLDGQVPRCSWTVSVACSSIRKLPSAAATGGKPTISALLPARKILTKNRLSIWKKTGNREVVVTNAGYRQGFVPQMKTAR